MSGDNTAAPLTARASGPLAGTIRPPGDKSISHRAIMLGALAVGETTVEGLLEGDDILATVAAMRAFGATVSRTGAGAWRVAGLGVGGLLEPEGVIDYGNAGTGVRLALGIAGSHAFATTFTGDASLVKRPMAPRARPAAPHGRPDHRPLRRPPAGHRARAATRWCRSNTAFRSPRRRSSRPCCWRR